MTQDLVRLLAQEDTKVRRLIRKQNRKEGKIAKALENDDKILGKKKKLMSELEAEQKKEQIKEICDELFGIIHQQEKIFEFEIAQNVREHRIGDDILHIVAIEIQQEDIKKKGFEAAYQVLSKKIKDKNFDQQHIIENEALFDRFRRRYAYDVAEKREEGRELREEQAVLSEENLIRNIIEGLLKNLRRQKDEVSRIRVAGKEGSTLKDLFDDELEKYNVLINHKSYEERILADLKSASQLHIQKKERRTWRGFLRDTKQLRRRGVAGAAILLMFYGPVRKNINEFFGSIKGYFVGKEQVQESNREYWARYSKEHGLVEYWKKYFWEGGNKTHPIESATPEEIIEFTSKIASKAIAWSIDYVADGFKESKDIGTKLMGTILSAFASVIRLGNLSLFILLYIFWRGVPVLNFPLKIFEKEFFWGLIYFGKDSAALSRYLAKRLRKRQVNHELRRVIHENPAILHHINDVTYWKNLILYSIEQHKDEAIAFIKERIRSIPKPF